MSNRSSVLTLIQGYTLWICQGRIWQVLSLGRGSTCIGNIFCWFLGFFDLIWLFCFRKILIFFCRTGRFHHFIILIRKISSIRLPIQGYPEIPIVGVQWLKKISKPYFVVIIGHRGRHQLGFLFNNTDFCEFEASHMSQNLLLYTRS